MQTLSTPAPAPTHAFEPKPHSAPTSTAPTSTPTAPTSTPADTADASAPSDPVEITCREERLDITTEWHVLGTAKLRKYVTSEQVERRIPVVRERVRVERIPVTDAERASLTKKGIAEAVEVVTLREERPVVRKYLAAIERVRLVVERYTEEEVVRDELRRENVEVCDNTPTVATTPNSTNGSMTPPADGSRPSALRPLV
ncbi:YsnF/AvaK domain-containing protein [Kitasatospora sp. NPDC053057]|uniref:YsnF/AvaK domain-containing protein n=1 Tax=Kitasatospora sp. NPDC053057 TaxID=3364062 RepID=UPI0037C83C58